MSPMSCPVDRVVVEEKEEEEWLQDLQAPEVTKIDGLLWRILGSFSNKFFARGGVYWVYPCSRLFSDKGQGIEISHARLVLPPPLTAYDRLGSPAMNGHAGLPLESHK